MQRMLTHVRVVYWCIHNAGTIRSHKLCSSYRAFYLTLTMKIIVVRNGRKRHNDTKNFILEKAKRASQNLV